MKRYYDLRSVFIILIALCSTALGAQNCLDLDGTDDVVIVPNASSLIVGGNGVSISCFVYPRNVTAGWPDMDGFIGFRNNTDADLFLIQTSPSNVEARFRNSGGASFDINYVGLVLNAWNHFALTYDGSMLRLFHNGAKVDSISAAGLINNPSESFYIGDLFFGLNDDFFLNGLLDEVGIWNRALAESEVACLFSTGPQLVDPNLKAYYHFDQGVAGGNNAGINALVDQMGTFNGQLTGFALNGSSSNWVGGVAQQYPTFFESICIGESILFNGQLLSSAGTHFTNYVLPNGCDSTVVLELEVTGPDVGVTQNGIQLNAVAIGAMYQWMDCNTNMALSGETAQTFTASQNGDYAVIVTENGCTDTSACFTVNSIGVEEIPWWEEVRYYVGTNGDLVIEGLRLEDAGMLELYDALGRKKAEVLISGSRSIIHRDKHPAGLAVLKLTDRSGRTGIGKIVLNGPLD